MVGRGHVPDLSERIVRSLKANTTRTAGGLGSNASPSMTRDRVGASRRGTATAAPPAARSSKVDDWDITGTGTSTFTTTYLPLADSWNLSLNGARVHRDEWSLSGRTVTISSPTDLFKGVTTQGSPWKLELQYDYSGAVPVAPPFQSAHVGVLGSATEAANHEFLLPSGVQAGDLMVCIHASKHGASVNTTAGWDQWHWAQPTYQQIICAKVIDTETAGSAITPINPFQGFWAAASVTIVRGMSASPLHDYAVNESSPPFQVTSDGGVPRFTVHGCCSSSVPPTPIISRGTQRISTVGDGIAAVTSEEEITGTVQAGFTQGDGFLASVVLNPA